MLRHPRMLFAGACLVSLAIAAAAAAPAQAPPAPAPGEFKVLFQGCSPGRPGTPSLFIADADFSDPVRISTPRFDPDQEDPTLSRGCDSGAWSPDGRRVAVSRNGILHLLELKALAELPDQQPVPVESAPSTPIAGWSPAWSPDGKWIVLHDEAKGLIITRPNGSGCRVLVPVSAARTWIREPEFSPDGQSIAIRAGSAYPHHLYLVTNLFGPGPAKLRQLTKGRYQDSWPHFSPDGKTLMFSRSSEPERNRQCGDVWLLDLATGEERQLTNTGERGAQGLGWCPFDDRIYYLEYEGPGLLGGSLVRVSEDGASERFDCPIVPVGRVTWANTGVWVDGVKALPGEEVVVKVAMQDADELAEAISDIGLDNLAALGVSRGRTIPHWDLLDPTLTGDVLSLHAYAPDPLTQHISGPAHLFDVWLGVPPQARADELRLLPFSGLYLGDKLGQPLSRLALAGSVQVLPFAALDLQVQDQQRDEEGCLAINVTVRALDRQGKVMVGCNLPVRLAFVGSVSYPGQDVNDKFVGPVSPAEVMLEGGQWSGRVLVPEFPHSLADGRVFVYWGDIAAYSPVLTPLPDR